MSSKNHEESGYDLDLNLLIVCFTSKENWAKSERVINQDSSTLDVQLNSDLKLFDVHLQLALFALLSSFYFSPKRS